jgi:hypothetical protein
MCPQPPASSSRSGLRAADVGRAHPRVHAPGHADRRVRPSSSRRSSDARFRDRWGIWPATAYHSLRAASEHCAARFWMAASQRHPADPSVARWRPRGLVAETPALPRLRLVRPDPRSLPSFVRTRRASDRDSGARTGPKAGVWRPAFRALQGSDGPGAGVPPREERGRTSPSRVHPLARWLLQGDRSMAISQVSRRTP